MMINVQTTIIFQHVINSWIHDQNNVISSTMALATDAYRDLDKYLWFNTYVISLIFFPIDEFCCQTAPFSLQICHG